VNTIQTERALNAQSYRPHSATAMRGMRMVNVAIYRRFQNERVYAY